MTEDPYRPPIRGTRGDVGDEVESPGAPTLVEETRGCVLGFGLFLGIGLRLLLLGQAELSGMVLG